jgi:hypothetical protein
LNLEDFSSFLLEMTAFEACLVKTGKPYLVRACVDLIMTNLIQLPFTYRLLNKNYGYCNC